jgi:hypothetical protein
MPTLGESEAEDQGGEEGELVWDTLGNTDTETQCTNGPHSPDQNAVGGDISLTGSETAFPSDFRPPAARSLTPKVCQTGTSMDTRSISKGSPNVH